MHHCLQQFFYEHRGYKTVEHRKHDIGDGEVMIYEIMRKNIILFQNN